MKECDGRQERREEPEADGHSVLRDRLHALAADLGGWDSLSYQEKSTCRRAIHLERHAEQDEKRLAMGLPVDCNLYLNFVNTLSGQWTKLGMKKRKKPVISLNDYIEAKATPAAPSQPGPATEETIVEEPAPDDDH